MTRSILPIPLLGLIAAIIIFFYLPADLPTAVRVTGYQGNMSFFVGNYTVHGNKAIVHTNGYKYVVNLTTLRDNPPLAPLFMSILFSLPLINIITSTVLILLAIPNIILLLTDGKKIGNPIYAKTKEINRFGMSIFVLFAFFRFILFIPLFSFLPHIVYLAPASLILLLLMIIRERDEEEKIDLFSLIPTILLIPADYAAIRSVVPLCDTSCSYVAKDDAFSTISMFVIWFALPVLFGSTLALETMLVPEDIDILMDTEFSIKMEVATGISMGIAAYLLMNIPDLILFFLIIVLLSMVAPLIPTKMETARQSSGRETEEGNATYKPSILLTVLSIASLILLIHPASILMIGVLSAGEITNKILNLLDW